MPGAVVACGSTWALMRRRDDPLHQYILDLAAKPRPRVLFLGTASGDHPDDIVAFYETYNSDRCAPNHLRLIERDAADLRAIILRADVIWAGGGSTAVMLAAWRVHGVDVLLREAWDAGCVVAGGSAGGICWFEGGTTDSFGPLSVLRDGLGWLPGAFCPHADSEDGRLALLRSAVADGDFREGLAAGDLAAVRFDGTRFVEAVSGHDGARVLRVWEDGGEARVEALPVRRLVDT